MAFQNNIISFENPGLAKTAFGFRVEHQDTVVACRGVLSRCLSSLMSGMFENLDDALYKLADKADTNQVQTGYFDAMRELRKQRKRIEKGFNSRMLEGYDRFWKNGSFRVNETKPGDAGGGGLSLMNKVDLEESLAVNTMASRGENRYYRELYALEQRFSHMAGGYELSGKNNPLAPAAICSAFHIVSGELILDLQVKLVVYKEFEHKVVDALGGFYTEVNRLLASAGILPSITSQIYRKPRYAGNAGARVPASNPGLPTYENESADLQTELFATLQQLLSKHRPDQVSVSAAESSHLPVMPPADVLAALSTLQNNGTGTLTSMAGYGTQDLDFRATIMQALQAGVAGQSGKKIGRADEDAIDVITMLFEIILEDHNLPDGMKALLARMQIPMLKVAILDKAFFSRKSHPARRLLNSMTQAAVDWHEENGRAAGGLYARMESIVRRILNEFEKDIGLFTELYGEFKVYLEQEERGSRVIEQRTAQVTKGKEQLEIARHRVFEEINNRLFGREQVPEVVVRLLKDGWKDLLLLTYLRKGEESPEWQHALDTMDGLLWTVSAKLRQRQRQELLERIPPLLKSLRTGLNGISYDQHKMACLFKDLQACHLSCLKGPTASPARDPEELTIWKEEEILQQPDPVTDVDLPQDPVADAAMIEEAPEADERIDDEFLRMAENLRIGTWLEVTRDESVPLRAKLSWRSRMSGACLFVNRKGMKVAEVDLPELATWFRDGKAETVADAGAAPVDLALSTMVTALGGCRT